MSKPIDELRYITPNDRDIVVCFDSDAMEKEQVQAAAFELAMELKRRGAKPRVAHVPAPTPAEEHKTGMKRFGVDDLVMARGKAALEHVIATAGRPIKPNTSSADEGTIAEQIGKKVLGEETFKFVADTLYVYAHGVYKPNGAAVVAKLAHNHLQGMWKPERVEAAKRYVELHSLDPNLTEAPRPDPGIINVRNGLLDLSGMVLKKHKSDVFTLAQLPVKYDPAAKCPAIRRFLNQIMPDADLVDLVTEMVGYALVPITSFERAFLLVGAGKNGKSTLIKLIEAVLGRANVSHIALQDLDDRFRLAEIHGKLVNTFADLDSRALRSTSNFKSVVTGDAVTAERKFCDPFTFHPYCKLIYSCNAIPYSDDHSEGYYRRWLFVPLNEEIKQPDRGLIDRLTTPEELSGFLNMALTGLKRLFANGDFTTPASAKTLLEDQKRQENAVLRFVEDRCVLESKTSAGKEARIPRKTLYAEYVEWARDTGVKYTHSDAGFAKALRAVVKNLTDAPKDKKGNRQWGGIGMRTGDDR